jgi:TonB family protein
VKGISGDVHLEARVDVDGRVRNVRVVRSIPELDNSAIESVKKFEFRPATKDGQPVPYIVLMLITFSTR